MATPTARRIPISRDFCTTETMSTLAMPSATATITKNWIMFFELDCAESPESSSALTVIQLSARSPVRPRTSTATRSASNTFATLSSIVVTPPGRA